ncbi:pyridoxal phosphate-dependent decarboxylase family protein [Jiangella rhizosphaerae]|uniref:Aspartate aminotransferase family protein n=1 Tax=Jiangella rhizosphaerae TaxID=2293569 RepID=A0A418KP65_9ACTN|nr:pyridoxal-dependent decarboxylase [Jiangella rhizosphaerae]RIQ21077.1 aspartate aminotransferase family protein [Jiangella rhizosphaerae]
MSAPRKDFDAALDVASSRARAWLDTLGERTVRAVVSADDVRAALGTQLPDGPSDPADVVRLLADAAEPGLVATPSGRFFGFVIGGTLPAALAADWLVSAWDQNAALRAASPAGTAVDDIAAAWLLDLLGLPSGAGVGFVTGATMANFAGLAAARDAVLARAGWDVGAHGLAGAPRVRVLVGEERHDSVDSALRYLGLGAPEAVAVDDQGRMRADAFAAALASGDAAGPVIVCLQAGNIHSGGFDPFAEVIPAAHAVGAWVHVDGAFGLWAGASPHTRDLVAAAGAADSWATDAHKTLNVPYDSGIVAVRDPAALRSAMSYHADYLVTDATYLEPYERVPELSRRARSVPVWAALRSLGRSGLAGLVDRLCRHATAFADGARAVPGAEVLNDVVFTQVCLAFGDDERTREVGRRLMADGTVWMTGSLWRGREVLRISVSNWSTDDADVARGLDALARAARTG